MAAPRSGDLASALDNGGGGGCDGNMPSSSTSSHWHMSDPCAVLGLRWQDRGAGDWPTRVKEASRPLLRTLHPDRALVVHGHGGTSSSSSTPTAGAVVGVRWVAPGTCEIRDAVGFTDVVAASNALLTSGCAAARTEGRDACSTGHMSASEDRDAAGNVAHADGADGDDGGSSAVTWSADKYDAIVRCAQAELDEAADPSTRGEHGDASAADRALCTRVCEILLEREHSAAVVAVSAQCEQDGAADTDHDDDGGVPAVDPGETDHHYRARNHDDDVNDEPSRAGRQYRNRRSESRRARRRGGEAAFSSLYRRPADPRQPTQHLHIANTGPKFGAEPSELARLLRDLVGGGAPGGDVSVTASGPSVTHVYASFCSVSAASAVADKIDSRRPGAIPLLGRAVTGW
jgi:hypothetical protein